MSAVGTTRDEAIARIEDAIWKFMVMAQHKGLLRGVPSIIRLDDREELRWKVIRDPNPSAQSGSRIPSGNVFPDPNKGLETLIVNSRAGNLMALDLFLRGNVLKVTSDGEHDKRFVKMFLDIHRDTCATEILRKLRN